MKLPIYTVDAFCQSVFTGNPAAVVPLDAWLTDDILLAIAQENNLSETAFIIGEGENWQIRWFTPGMEVALCGHATLGAAHAIFENISKSATQLNFTTRCSGTLIVRKEHDEYILDFPKFMPERVDIPAALAKALGGHPIEVWKANYADTEYDYLVVYPTELDVVALNPSFIELAALDARGAICTAKGSEMDFVSRYFAPAVNVPEDPFTGSAHCILTPYWAHHLGKSMLKAKQISARGGWAECRLIGDRVEFRGKAVTYLTGMIDI
jgi:PhzF family phenazine biosynthesis protein